MGLETTNRPELNEYEAFYHADNVKMWLHDIVDGVKIASLLSVSNLIKAIDFYFGITGLGGISQEATSAYDLAQSHDSTIFEHSGRISALEAAGSGGAIIGEVRMWAASTAPSKWLLCDGAAISRTTYDDLFALVGTTYGTGDGTTTFNLPDFRGRAPIGAGQGSGLTNRALGEVLGEEAHANTSVENGTHTHTGPSHTHTGPSHTHTIAHSHQVTINGVSSSGSARGCPAGLAGGSNKVVTSGDSSATNSGSGGTEDTGSSGTGATGSSGSGTAHNTMQPSLVMNFIIYSGVES